MRSEPTYILLLELACEMPLHEGGLANATVADQHQLELRDLLGLQVQQRAHEPHALAAARDAPGESGVISQHEGQRTTRGFAASAAKSWRV
eukprot:SAG31_NODE_597_length_13674_cov_3.402947_9_plen_91_part_00